MSRKILVTEDEKPIANALENKLKSEGFEVQLASNGQEALDALAKGRFDLVLLDIMMPVVDGFEVLEKMKKENNKTPVIVMSNLGQENDIAKVKSLGAKDYFVKSDMPIMKLVEIINRALNG